jgi:hypothetical protein
MSPPSSLSRLLPSALMVILPGVGFAASNAVAATAGWSVLHIGFFLVGLGVASYWSVIAFGRPAVLAEIPTPPRYMTRKAQYEAGRIAFAAICVVLYAMLAFGHREALPAIQLFSPELYERFAREVEGNAPNYVMVVLLVTAVFLALLKLETDWNPLFLLRQLIHRWVSIPQFAAEIVSLGEAALEVPAGARAAVAGNKATPHVAPGDFDKDRQTVDRIWAELAYLYLWLRQQEQRGADATFFNEPSFGWAEIRREVAGAAAQVAALKEGSGRDLAQAFTDGHELLSGLRRKVCRLVACYLVFRNGTEEDVRAAARAIGIPMADCACENPLRYAVIYVVGISASVYVAVNTSAFLYDVATGVAPMKALAQPPELVTRWVALCAANIGVPIIVILALRCLGWTADPHRRQAYLVAYCWVFLVALVVAPLSLAGAMKLVASAPVMALPYLALVQRAAKWAIIPALVAVYVAYYLDRQTDPRLPNVGEGSSIAARLLNAFLFALFVLLVSLPPTATIRASQQPAVWPTEKLQVVAAGTMFFMALALAAIAQFALRKPAAARAAAPAPSGAAGTSPAPPPALPGPGTAPGAA